MLIVPHSVDTTRATLWLYTRVEPRDLVGTVAVVVNGDPRTLAVRWQQGQVDLGRTVGVQRLAPCFGSAVLDGLKPDTVHTVRAAQDHEGSSVVFRTHPTQLPRRGDDPFRVILASCFHYARGKATNLGRNRIAGRQVPHMKFLSGDQVYLDLPAVREILPRDAGELFEVFQRKYETNWFHHFAGSRGFGDFLQWGGNMFLSDDHEFWNNYPIPSLLSGLSRQDPDLYRRGAQAMFSLFQSVALGSTPPTFQRFDVGAPPQISFATLDARYHRTRKHSFAPRDLEAVDVWLRDLKCPGVLVMSQPLFDLHPRPWSLTGDAYPANYGDYGKLIASILRPDISHDLLILSGDNHGGRIARTLRGNRTVWEIISSPLALCFPHPSWHDEPARPEFPMPRGGVRATEIKTFSPLVQCDHFATIDFVRDSGMVAFSTTFWPLGSSSKPIRPRSGPGLEQWEYLK